MYNLFEEDPNPDTPKEGKAESEGFRVARTPKGSARRNVVSRRMTDILGLFLFILGLSFGIYLIVCENDTDYFVYGLALLLIALGIALTYCCYHKY